MKNKAQFGILLPHFGPHAKRERLIDDSIKIEKLGFDSVWVRDHVVFKPHSYEDSDLTHVDPLITMSAIASATSTLVLGTATLIPHRNPIHAALALGSLDFLAGPNRIIVGMGIGAGGHEFESIGMGEVDRVVLTEEQVHIMRELWTGKAVTHKGDYYEFSDVEIRPIPAGGRLPVWYGGNSYAAARRAVEYCDGWLPARMPRFALRRRLDRLNAVMDKTGRTDTPTVGIIPYVAPGATVEEAVRSLNMEEYFSMSERSFGTPPGSDSYRTIRDLDGGAIAGPPDVIVEEVEQHLSMGVDHFVFDFRVRFREWEDCLALIGEEVLPRLKENR